MQGNSRAITTTQTGPHDKLDELVLRYKNSGSKRPLSDHTIAAWQHIQEWLADWHGPLILDSCCGVGESSATLAKRYPQHRIIGVDKSALRVDKHQHYAIGQDNYRVVRADVNDLWRLLVEANIQFDKHYLLYPNPYPKSSQVQKRWHASAAMPALMALSNAIEVRSNWRIYLEEFAIAARHYQFDGDLIEVENTGAAITPFERKYLSSGQSCWRLALSRSG